MLRTPDSRFDDLPGWPYLPQHLQPLGVDGPRMAVVDEGMDGHQLDRRDALQQFAGHVATPALNSATRSVAL